MKQTKALEIAIRELQAESRKCHDAKVMYDAWGFQSALTRAKKWDEINQAIEILQNMREALLL